MASDATFFTFFIHIHYFFLFFSPLPFLCILEALGVGEKEVNQVRDTIHLDITNPDNLKASGPRSLFNKEHGKLSLAFLLFLVSLLYPVELL